MKIFNKKTFVSLFLPIMLMFANYMVAFAAGEDGEIVSNYYSTFWALIPPFVAIALALITKEVYSSLFIGIVLGGLLSANWQPVAALDNILNAGLIDAVSGTAGIFIFLVILGA